ncbi:hypothetical protein FACS1894190_14730 [Spirochaetia bacterium]|nr:hypothetical protein FACS1894190_14730 [Spirochaetia bacterium]
MNSTDVKSFILFTDQAAYLKRLSLEEAGRVMLAVFNYVETGNVPELAPLPDMVFSLITDAIKRNKMKYDSICEKRRNSALVKWEKYRRIQQNTKNANADFVEPCSHLNYDPDRDRVRDRVRDPDSEKNQYGAKAPALSKKKFTKPSPPEIQNYCSQRNNNIDPDQFYNFYESKGWLVGKTPMKDWKAAIRTWENRDRDKTEGNQNLGVEL